MPCKKKSTHTLFLPQPRSRADCQDISFRAKWSEPPAAHKSLDFASQSAHPRGSRTTTTMSDLTKYAFAPAGDLQRTDTATSNTRRAHNFAAKIVNDPEYRAGLLARARAGKLPAGVEVLILHYFFGKPRDVVDLNTRTVGESLSELSNDELIARHHALTQRFVGLRAIVANKAIEERQAETPRDALGVAWDETTSRTRRPS